jgi:hypothetical protein
LTKSIAANHGGKTIYEAANHGEIILIAANLGVGAAIHLRWLRRRDFSRIGDSADDGTDAHQ